MANPILPQDPESAQDSKSLERANKILRQRLAHICNLADKLDSQLVTRDDGILESMYTYETQEVRDDLHEAVELAWIAMGEIDTDAAASAGEGSVGDE